VRAQQYFVEPANELNQYRNLGDFLEIIVGVDPDFEYVYKFAGIAIPYDTGRLRFANTPRAIDFLERGTKRFPNNWELRLYLGFYLLNFAGDSARAAEQFAVAAPLPGAPQYLKRFAARLFAVSGDLEQAKTFTEQMLSLTADPAEKLRLENRLKDIELEGRLREVEAAARRFRDAKARWPSGLEELAIFERTPSLPEGSRLENGTVTAPTVARLVIHEHPTEAPMRAAQ
jgi:tetratricopeptide (TPR) repeat protein